MRGGQVVGDILPDAAVLHQEVIVHHGLGVLTVRAEGVETGGVVARGVEGLATPAARDEGHRGDFLRVTPMKYQVIIVRAF